MFLSQRDRSSVVPNYRGGEICLAHVASGGLSSRSLRPISFPGRPWTQKRWIAVAFSQKVRSACITRGVAVGKVTPSISPFASQVTSRRLAGSPVDFAPNSSMTLGAT